MVGAAVLALGPRFWETVEVGETVCVCVRGWGLKPLNHWGNDYKGERSSHPLLSLLLDMK